MIWQHHALRTMIGQHHALRTMIGQGHALRTMMWRRQSKPEARNDRYPRTGCPAPATGRWKRCSVTSRG